MTSVSHTMLRWDDGHNHAREGAAMAEIVPIMAKHFGRVVWMPNTTRPIITAKRAAEYRDEIWLATGPGLNGEFEPVVTLKLVPSLVPAEIEEAAAQGITLVKYYPEGVTTNSADGIHPHNLQKAYPTLEKLQEVCGVLLIHGEHPDYEVFDRERAFLPVLEQLARDFPGLRMVLEHVSTADAVAMVCQLPESVMATVTAHHLASTITDMMGGHLEVHMNCKPPLKNNVDRKAIQEVSFSGNPKFALGSDSARHPVGSKETCMCAAGAYTAPILMQLVTHLFHTNQALDNLEAFTSRNYANFHGWPLNESLITLELREECFDPGPLGDVVVFPYNRDPESKEPMKFSWHVVDG